MKRHMHRSAIFLLSGLLFCASAQASVQRDSRDTHQGQLSGSILLNGCSADGVRLLLEAQPLTPGEPIFDREKRKPERDGWDSERRRGVVVAAEQVGPRSFVFRFDGLREGGAYRIGIKLVPRGGRGAPPNPCGDLVWEGLPASIAIAGQDPVEITGTAIQGQLRVFNAPPDRAGRRWPGRWSRAWSRAGAFDLGDPMGATPQLRWSPPAGATQGVLQIALERFDRDLNRANCAAPEGLVFQGDVDVAELEEQGDGSYLLPAVDLREVIVPPITDGTLAVEFPDDVLPDDLPPLETSTVSEGDYQKILLGKPLYVRVVPVAEGTPACNLGESGIPPWVILALIDALQTTEDPPVVDDVTLEPYANYVGPVVYTWPNGDHMCMRTTKLHQLNPSPFEPFDTFAKIWTGSSYNQTLPANTRFCWKFGHSGGGFDPIGAIGEVVGGALSAFEWLVDGISGVWASVKKFAVNAVADGLDSLGIPCDSACKSVLTAGLEIGLVAAGIPPSLPNFEQLKQQGLDYIASQVASQTGLPTDVTEYAVHHGYKALASEFTDQISKKRVSGIPLVDWAVWENGIEPATLSLRVYRSAASNLPNALRVTGNEVHSSAIVPLPRVFVDANGQPGADYLDLNIALMPNLDGWKQPGPITVKMPTGPVQIDPTAHQITVSQKAYWKTRILQKGCVSFAVNRNFYVPFVGWVHYDTIASYPGMPVLMRTTIPSLSKTLVEGVQYCQP